jgi:hypothetical protein
MVWYFDFHHEGAICWGEWDLHRHGEISLAPGGSRPAKPRGRLALVERCPPTQDSPPQVDAWQPRFGPNNHKPRLAGDDDFDI